MTVALSTFELSFVIIIICLSALGIAFYCKKKRDRLRDEVRTVLFSQAYFPLNDEEMNHKSNVTFSQPHRSNSRSTSSRTTIRLPDSLALWVYFITCALHAANILEEQPFLFRAMLHSITSEIINLFPHSIFQCENWVRRKVYYLSGYRLQDDVKQERLFPN